MPTRPPASTRRSDNPVAREALTRRATVRRGFVEAPLLDVNYGLIDNLQLKYEGALLVDKRHRDRRT